MDSTISGVIIDKAGGRSRFDVLIARLTTWGGNTTHSAHIACGLLVVSLFLAADCNARDLNQRFDFRIREETLGAALDELVYLTDLIVLYPHELAEKTGMNPVVGYYTAREAIEILFRDTKFSGGLTENGVIHISFSDDVQANSGEKRMKSNTLRRSLLTGVSAILVGAGSVSAQTEQTAHAEETFGAGTIDVITVTAQKRSRDLQDVPFSVSALGGEQLERLGAEGFETFAQRIPGLQLSNYATGTTQLSLRGVSTGLDAADRPQVGVTVGLYLDETQLSMSANNPDLQLFDLERVEVLRGPQGTLFGAGATSGVIRLISRKPNMESYEMTLGSEISSTRGGDVNYTVHGVANVPLSENAGIRLLGYYDRAGGFMDNSILGLEDTDEVTNVGGRLAFLVEPTARSSVLARIIYQEREAEDESWWDSDSPFPERAMIALEPGDNEILIADLTAEFDLDFATVTAVSSYTDRTRRSHPATRSLDRMATKRRSYPNGR